MNTNKLKKNKSINRMISRIGSMRYIIFIRKTITTIFSFFFLNDTAPTEIYTLPLHDALPISPVRPQCSLSAAPVPRHGGRRAARRASLYGRPATPWSTGTSAVCGAGFGVGRVDTRLRTPLPARHPACQAPPRGPQGFEGVDGPHLVHTAGMAEAQKAGMAVVRTGAAGADAAKWQAVLGNVQQGATEGDTARGGCRQHLLTGAALVAEQVQGQRAFMAGHQGQRPVQVLVGHDGQDGAEDLLLHQPEVAPGEIGRAHV